ncbi:hypothetical protein [Bradyrhizobium sp. AZCC 2289]|uniref:hypothetical protein n=1 Tax=Bradyrhizobium sp. AZCC 2289 TaxID=3117026 RepID=UPI002FF0D7A4
MTLQRPMFPPVDQTRRHVLTLAAGAVAATIAPAESATAPAPDPVFDLIEMHRRTHAAHMASLKLQDRLERRYGISSRVDWVSTKPCHDESEAFEALVATPPTTLSGLLAWLDYFQELSSEFETEWMINDRADAAVLVESFAASLKNIGGLA